jgi:hypothetical protein
MRRWSAMLYCPKEASGMGGKVKMRCARCGKPFKSAGAKQNLCDACTARARAERAVSKATAARPATATPAPAPRIVGPGAAILGAIPTQTLVPPEISHFGEAPSRGQSGDRHEQHGHQGHEHGQGHEQGHGQYGDQRHPAASQPAHDQRHPGAAHPAHPAHSAQAGQGKPAVPQAAKPPKRQEPREPKPPKQPKQLASTVELTDELRTRIEARYVELAQPVEFDGIRTQIAAEVGVPKHIVKRAVLGLRQRMQMPSWWELQAFTGEQVDLERVRQAYLPHLPVPAVGIHKQIASDLGLEPVSVYHAIKRVRAELHLPQYNPPEAHGMPSATAQNGMSAEANRDGGNSDAGAAVLAGTEAADPEATDAR